MSQFKVVKKTPTKLEENEFVISYPDFAAEIDDSCARVAQPGKKRLTENNMMRNALALSMAIVALVLSMTTQAPAGQAGQAPVRFAVEQRTPARDGATPTRRGWLGPFALGGR